MADTSAVGEARQHLEQGRPIEAMNILMKEWEATPGDPDLRLDLARVARAMKSLRHRQVLCKEIGGGDSRFGRAVEERYLLLERLSESAGVTLYRARDEEQGGDVTLWMLDPLWRNSTLEQGWVLDQLGGLQGFHHPAAARILRFGAPADDLVFATLEPPEGSLISEILATVGPFPLAKSVEIVTALLEALVAAHEAGVIHGNLRPDHLSLPGGRVRILDFGLYPLIRQLHRARTVTRTGEIPGSFPRLPPELEESAPPGPRWDIYSAGAMAFEILTGGPPFGIPEPRQRRSFILRIKESPLPKAAETEGGRGLPPWVDEILEKMLSRDPDGRFPTAAAALEAWRQHAG